MSAGRGARLIMPGATIGIVGGGQLGRMMALAARQMGYRSAVLDPTSDSPGGQVADREIVADYDDPKALRQLGEVSDVVTFEFENVDVDALRSLAGHAYLPQGTGLLEKTQDRVTEKSALRAIGVPVTAFVAVDSLAQLRAAADQLGLPAVLKTRRGGYDGKGQWVLRNDDELACVATHLPEAPLILERLVDFERELSVIVHRGVNGDLAVQPVGDNEHRNGVLHRTVAPGRLSPAVVDAAHTLGRRIATAFGLVGTLAVELFAVGDQVMVNELAPRPHNSGHFTVDTGATSQFAQHIRAVCGWPLGDTAIKQAAACTNILGEHLDAALAAIDRFDDARLHLYGKHEARQGRKMGHVTVLADTPEQAIARSDALGIW